MIISSNKIDLTITVLNIQNEIELYFNVMTPDV